MEWEPSSSSHTTDVGTKAEPWREAVPEPQDGKEVDLHEYRARGDENRLVDNSDDSTEPDTSKFSSYYAPYTMGSSILESSTRTRHSNAPNTRSCLSSSRREASSSKRDASTSSPVRMDITEEIPLHCRMDSLHPSVNGFLREHPSVSNFSGISSTDRQISTAEAQMHRSGRNKNRNLMTNGTGTSVSHVPQNFFDKPQTTRRHQGNAHTLFSQVPCNTPYPADTDEAKLKRVENHLSKFTHGIDTAQLLPRLKECLPHDQYTHVRNQIQQGNRLQTNQLLWKYLKRAPRWWQYLEAALLECGYRKLYNLMQEDRR